jgi:hypothetical protein
MWYALLIKDQVLAEQAVSDRLPGVLLPIIEPETGLVFAFEEKDITQIFDYFRISVDNVVDYIPLAALGETQLIRLNRNIGNMVTFLSGSLDCGSAADVAKQFMSVMKTDFSIFISKSGWSHRPLQLGQTPTIYIGAYPYAGNLGEKTFIYDNHSYLNLYDKKDEAPSSYQYTDSDGNEVALARFFANSCYISLKYDSVKSLMPLMLELVAAFVEYIGPDGSLIPQRLAEYEQDQMNKLMLALIRGRSKSLKDEADQAKQDIEEYRSKLIAAIQTNDMAERALAAIDLDRVQADFHQELSMIRRAQEIDSVTAESGAICLIFKPVILAHENKDYYIGKIKISIFPNGQVIPSVLPDPILDAFPHSRRNQYPHPHATMSSFCFGNFTTDLAEVLAMYDFSALYSLLATAVLQYNASSPHCHIEAWPTVEQVRTKFPEAVAHIPVRNTNSNNG